MDRKDFLKLTGAACGLTFMGSFWAACNKSDTAQPTANFEIDLSDSANASLANVGGWITKNNINIIHTSSGFIAISAICTHQGCTVTYQSSANDFYCPCHGGKFDINGNVTGGPPPSSLKKYTVTQNGTVLTIT